MFEIYTVTTSVPMNSWAFAENEKGDKLFIRVANGKKLRLQGADLIECELEIGEIPPTGAKVLVNDIIPAEREGKYAQAKLWMDAEHAKKMVSAKKKARETLAERAAEAQAENERRQEIIRANLERKRGSGGKKKEKNGVKVRSH